MDSVSTNGLKFQRLSVKLCDVNQLRIPVDIGHPAIKGLAVAWNAYGMLTGIELLVRPLRDREPRPARQRSSGSRHPEAVWAPPPILELVGRLRHYFSCGQPLGTLPWEWIDQSGWTPFQYQVYAWIAKIPHGETRTYGWVAQRIGKGTATRAVGQALKKNPLPIFIPCHRVVAADSLGGFMGSTDPSQPELSLKLRLLTLEQGYLNPSFSFMSAMTSAALPAELR